jgi:signal transduction histidine kinase
LQLQLLARAPDDASRQQALIRLNEGLDRSAHLIEQLLTAARTDPNDRMPELQPTNLAELMRQAIGDVYVFAQARRIDIDQDAPEEVTIRADAPGLRVLARNLLDNAVRYTPEGGRVHVCIDSVPGAVRLVVEDSGPGIPDEEQGRVFDRFFRGSANGQPGSGLGLAIVKNIVEQHGAHIALGRSAHGGLKVSILFTA